ncbi:lipocalin-like domain-containing protein [Aquabacterium sp. OR-4]|uniref:lipocalin-like domain-containing protein n=1 Tax=Aquabacterium sp. OR-4 TaxID=2978127 RepID=UPI0028C6E3D6|nr:carotenoid 1,2-hydratase [Aquabacterium sp. OR-4]MDT7835110.1 carotenoid 1,2-hydratase [Aquabacterium sp. OR-4]
MHPSRRRWLGLGAWAGLGGLGAVAPRPATAGPDGPDDDRIQPGRPLRFARDHGAHPGARTEWWYATGWLGPAAAPRLGFQLTFFRSRPAAADAASAGLQGRFAPRQWLFAHAAITDLAAGRHRHAQRLSRWSGDEALPEAHARRADTALVLGPWRLQRQPLPDGGSHYLARLAAPEAGFTLALQLRSTQPLLLQGDAGFSRKGPLPSQASHYYSQPQLAVQAELQLDGQRLALPGTGWLDHEWSDELLAPGATGWDWIGINLLDGGALTAFQLRDSAQRALWAGGSHRAAGGGPVRSFAPQELRFEPLQEWTSPQTGARYPVRWRVHTPLGTHELRALLDAQELDSRGSTGAIYWEGLAELLDQRQRRVGLGYLEMTGRSAPLKLG